MLVQRTRCWPSVNPSLAQQLLFSGEFLWAVTHARLRLLNTKLSPNVDLMLVQRRRRWPNIKSTLGQYLVPLPPVKLWEHHCHLQTHRLRPPIVCLIYSGETRPDNWSAPARSQDVPESREKNDSVSKTTRELNRPISADMTSLMPSTSHLYQCWFNAGLTSQMSARRWDSFG